MWESVDRVFQAYIRPLETVTFFKYLGQVLTAAYYDWPAVVGNLWKAQKSWAWLARIMGQEVSRLRVYWGVIQGGGACGSFICFLDVGADPLHGTRPGELPAQVH